MAAAAGGGGPRATLAVFGSLCAGTFGLGCWQTARYFEKVDLVKLREEELAIIGSDNDLPSSSSSSSFKRFQLRGKFRHEDEIWLGPRGPPPGAMAADGPNSGRSSGGMSSSPQGYFVITPMELQSQQKRVVLVNRGWVPLNYARENLSWKRPIDTVNIVGTVSSMEQPPKWIAPPSTSSKTPKQFLWMERAAMEKITNTTSQDPLFITEIETDNEEKQKSITFPVKPKADTVGEFKVLPPTHAAYAFTWFGLSGAGVLMTRRLLNRVTK